MPEAVRQDATPVRVRILQIVMCLLALYLVVPGPAQAHEVDTVLITNAQGTVVAESDSHGNVTYTAAYRPYGKQQTGAPKAGPGYTGHVNDPDTGLVYMQARYYDPGGRFLSPDPVGPAPGNIFSFNRYTYANNNPITNTDPTGKKVSFGSNTNKDYVRQYKLARAYLVSHGAAGVLLALEKSKVNVTLNSQGPWKGDYFGVMRSGGLMIAWGAKTGLWTKGGIISPALSLLHEAAHALGRINGNAASNIHDGSRFTDPEEKRVIEGVEDPAAKKLGEPVRDDHYGYPVPVGCSTCRKSKILNGIITAAESSYWGI